MKRKAIGIALEMVSSRNVEEVVLFLKKQLQGTLDQGFDKVSCNILPFLYLTPGQNLEYRQLLIQSIHSCAIRFSEVAANVVYVLMDFLGDSNNPSAVDVIAFVREVVEKFPKLRTAITEKLISTFGEIKSGKVFRGAMWIVGEYCEQPEDIKQAIAEIQKVLGEIPILASEQVRTYLLQSRTIAYPSSDYWTRPKQPMRLPPSNRSNPRRSPQPVCSPTVPTPLKPCTHLPHLPLVSKPFDPLQNRHFDHSSLVVTFSPVAFSLLH